MVVEDVEGRRSRRCGSHSFKAAGPWIASDALPPEFWRVVCTPPIKQTLGPKAGLGAVPHHASVAGPTARILVAASHPGAPRGGSRAVGRMQER